MMLSRLVDLAKIWIKGILYFIWDDIIVYAVKAIGWAILTRLYYHRFAILFIVLGTAYLMFKY